MKTSEIRDCYGVDDRTLRYVLEENFADIKPKHPGTGNSREFSPREALLVAAACVLYEQGFKGGAIAQLTKEISRQWRSDEELTLPLGNNGRTFGILHFDVKKLRRTLKL